MIRYRGLVSTPPPLPVGQRKAAGRQPLLGWQCSAEVPASGSPASGCGPQGPPCAPCPCRAPHPRSPVLARHPASPALPHFCASPGNYMPVAGAAECRPCEPRYACESAGQEDSFVTPCAAGHYCPLGTSLSTQFPCPTGYYTDRQDLFREEDCEMCGSPGCAWAARLSAGRERGRGCECSGFALQLPSPLQWRRTCNVDTFRHENSNKGAQ